MTRKPHAAPPGLRETPIALRDNWPDGKKRMSDLHFLDIPPGQNGYSEIQKGLSSIEKVILYCAGRGLIHPMQYDSNDPNVPKGSKYALTEQEWMLVESHLGQKKLTFTKHREAYFQSQPTAVPAVVTPVAAPKPRRKLPQMVSAEIGGQELELVNIEGQNGKTTYVAIANIFAFFHEDTNKNALQLITQGWAGLRHGVDVYTSKAVEATVDLLSINYLFCLIGHCVPKEENRKAWLDFKYRGLVELCTWCRANNYLDDLLVIVAGNDPAIQADIPQLKNALSGKPGGAFSFGDFYERDRQAWILQALQGWPVPRTSYRTECDQRQEV